MKSTNFNLVRYDADEGKVFDWAEPRYEDDYDDQGNVIGNHQVHLYVTTLFIGALDSIDNYIEVVKEEE